MHEPAYLADPAFSEPHTGPVAVGDNGVRLERDPSPEQFRRMCLAIRKTWSLKEDRKRRGVVPRLRTSQADHVPHGIAAEEIGAGQTLDIFR